MPSKIYDNLSFNKVSVSNAHSIGLLDNKIVGWGSDAKGKLSFPSEHKYTDVCCGYSHSAAITDDGLLVCVGNSNNGKTNSDSTIYHKSVRCSRNYTAGQAEFNTDGIVVYGVQTSYKSLPSSLYKCLDTHTGYFQIPDSSCFDISDEGKLLVAKDKEVFILWANKIPVVNDITTLFSVNPDRRVSKIVACHDGSVALLLCDDGNGVRIFVGENGMFECEHLGRDLVSVFAGEGYFGWANNRRLYLRGEHFGYVNLPEGWCIQDVVGSNNGYAITVQDEEGNKHTVLCGNNTINKELVIKGYASRENPRNKESIAVSVSDMTYDVRKAKVQKSPVVIRAITQGASSDYECEPCGYRFVSIDPKCPLCKCEVVPNG